MYRDEFPKHVGMAAIILTLILLLLAICVQKAQSQDKISEWQEAIVLCNFHNQSETTGFFVSKDGVIATTFHLIRSWYIFVDGYHIYVVPHGEERPYKAEVVGFNKSADILFLKINYKPKFWFKEFRHPEHGEKCIAMGLPYGWRIALEARITTLFKDIDILGIDRIPLPGASGSAILSEKGEVIGMLRAKYGVATITSGIHIKLGLQRIKKQ